MAGKRKAIFMGSFLTAGALGVALSESGWATPAEVDTRASQTGQAVVAQLANQTAPQATSQAVSSTALTPAPEIDRINAIFTDLAERNSTSVVNVYVKDSGPKRGQRGRPGFRGDPRLEPFFQHPFGQEMIPQEREALGSGFVLDTEGHIVTNAHVVHMAGRNASEVMVKFKGEDQEAGHRAKIVGVDELTDVALLKLEKPRPGLKGVVLGDSDGSKIGEWVIAIGNPYGHTHTVTQGIVSAIGRSLEGVRSDFLQTSASINPGNSGGPLFNMKGEVIGINTAIDPRAQGIGFAIPVNTAKNVITQLKDKGRVSRAWMGVGIQDLSEEIAGYMSLKDTKGVLIQEVMPNGPAAKAGIRNYDIVRKIDGKSTATSRDLLQVIDRLPVGQAAEIEVLRNGKAKSMKIELSERPSNT